MRIPGEVSPAYGGVGLILANPILALNPRGQRKTILYQVAFMLTVVKVHFAFAYQWQFHIKQPDYEYSEIGDSWFQVLDRSDNGWYKTPGVSDAAQRAYLSVLFNTTKVFASIATTFL